MNWKICGKKQSWPKDTLLHSMVQMTIAGDMICDDTYRPESKLRLLEIALRLTGTEKIVSIGV
jgi:hypothetical protein